MFKKGGGDMNVKNSVKGRWEKAQFLGTIQYQTYSGI